MREIKVVVYQGDIVRLADGGYADAVQSETFHRSKGMAVQQFSYRCARQEDMAGTVFGLTQHVIIDFTVLVRQAQQNVFYEKLLDNALERFTFLFNALFADDKLKAFDNAIMAEGYVVDVEESGSNDNEQAMMHVKILASELTYLHQKNDNLVLTISK